MNVADDMRSHDHGLCALSFLTPLLERELFRKCRWQPGSNAVHHGIYPSIGLRYYSLFGSHIG